MPASRFWTDMDDAIARWDVLQHPFYLRWSAGELRAGELGRYATQYRHAVEALAGASEGAAARAAGPAAAALAEHAAEERAHVALWDEFAAAVDAPAARPAAATRALAATWAGEENRSLPETLAALYAIESPQPAISTTKRDGLVRHYGVAPGRGTVYFELHARRDVEHAALHRELLDAHVTPENAPALVAEAERVAEAYWNLLDELEAAEPAVAA